MGAEGEHWGSALMLALDEHVMILTALSFCPCLCQ